jgi:integrase
MRLDQIRRRDVQGLVDRMSAAGALAGLRRGEIRALRVGHIDFAASVIRVRLSRDECAGDITLTSDAGRRDVPILGLLRPILLAQVASLGLEARTDDFAAPGPRGCLDADRYIARCRKAWEKAGLASLGLHDARHTFASLLIASDADVKQISRIMGHSSVTVTLDVYGHLLPGYEAEAGAKMDAYLAGALA